MGLACALGLAEYGATIYVTGRTEKDDMLLDFLKGTTICQTADDVNQMGGVGIAHKCDHSKDEDVERLFERVMNEQGKLDILVNSAWAGGSKHVLGGISLIRLFGNSRSLYGMTISMLE